MRSLVKVRKKIAADEDVRALRTVMDMGVEMGQAYKIIARIYKNFEYRDFVEHSMALYKIIDFENFSGLAYNLQRKIVKMLMLAVDAYLEDLYSQPTEWEGPYVHVKK